LALDTPVDLPRQPERVAAFTPVPSARLWVAGGTEEFLHHRSTPAWYAGAPVGGADMAVGESIDDYVPRVVAPEVWAVVGPPARAWAARTPASNGFQAVQRLKPLAQYLAWRHGGGMTVTDPTEVFRSDEIEFFIGSACGQLADGTRRTYRSALRTIGEHIAGWETACPDRGQPIGKTQPVEPYSPAELSAILGAIRGRPTMYQRHSAQVLVALGRGAGLTSLDIAVVVGTDIETTQNGNVVVHVPAPNRREVTVLRAWGEEVSRIAGQSGQRPLFRSQRTKIQRNDIARFCERLNWADAPALSVHRLRVSWIVEHLEAGTPLAVLSRTAGVGATSIARYAQYAATVSTGRSRELLQRGHGHT
jgi:hypothetical protein